MRHAVIVNVVCQCLHTCCECQCRLTYYETPQHSTMSTTSSSLFDVPSTCYGLTTQIGLPSTWISPDNADFFEPLCPPSTVAHQWAETRGPYFRDVFQVWKRLVFPLISTPFFCRVHKRSHGSICCCVRFLLAVVYLPAVILISSLQRA